MVPLISAYGILSASAHRFNDVEESHALSTAMGRIATCWQLTNEQMAAALGISAASASRLKAGNYPLKRGDKAFELGQYILRLFRSLDALLGSDDRAARSWLRTENLDLEAKPIDLIKTVHGLTMVADYVDDFRAKI